ncbi:helix-turn-helix domain-containing protein [Leptotrichia trevisanii]|uniref:helix-turn-helix domain-containing protein n=1 Tax=Leptotrichia trevisanii TaxID=109328 RepID=UPI0003F84B2C|nr:helix-turn-helix transcriptional regulator [Leptotrichia trevisanii]
MNLKKIIKEKGLKTGYLAEKLHLSYTSLKKKIRGEVEFKTTEIALLKEELGLTNEEISSIFFEKIVNIIHLNKKGVRGWEKKMK